MTQIATYVFLDLETTGLPSKENNKTCITELSMVALKRSHILESASGTLPRVVHKVTMCFNPNREIDPIAGKTSRLSNHLLENQPAFNDDVITIINTFLKSLQKPVCLIAHNGHFFDFPILKNHYMKLGAPLPKDVMCVDSIYCFYDLSKLPTGAGISGQHQHVANNSTNGNNFEDAKDGMDPPSKRRRFSGEMEIRPAKDISAVLRYRYYDGDRYPNQPFTLVALYERTLNKSADGAHTAEGDCLMMVEIAISMGRNFIEWVDANTCAFEQVTAMPVSE